MKAKIALEDLAKGAVPRALLDDGQPIRNVPGSLASEGHTVLRKDRDPAWRCRFPPGPTGSRGFRSPS